MHAQPTAPPFRSTPVVGIVASSVPAGVQLLLDFLGGALGIRFLHQQLSSEAAVDAWIVVAARADIMPALAGLTRPCFVVFDESETTPLGDSAQLRFADAPELDRVLRRQLVTAADASTIRALPAWLPSFVPLAWKSERPIWGRVSGPGAAIHVVSGTLPAIGADDALFSHFSGDHIARLLPLICFLIDLVRLPDEAPPPLQAAFMIDDPNLHWPSYGYIDFAELARHAVHGEYHVAFATVPLDAWFEHPRASALFRSSATQLSLLYHGNDHVFHELGRSQSVDAFRRELTQAERRIQAMERRTGLSVSRVMAPPHGACREPALEAMASLQFEAACVSRGSLRHHNPDAAWTRTIGMRPCAWLRGLPVMHRFGLTGTSVNDALVAALLRQPIVPMTHHQTMANGCGPLDTLAQRINTFGEVSWGDMTTLSRRLFSSRRDQRTLHVHMWSRRIALPVSSELDRIVVTGVGDSDAPVGLRWRAAGGALGWNTATLSEPFGVPAATLIDIEHRPHQSSVLRQSSGLRLLPLARRVLTEGRDRMLPMIRRPGRQATAAV